MKYFFAIPFICIVFASCLNAADYDRAAFKHWSDANHDHFDTRQEALRQQAILVIPPIEITRNSNGNYKVLSGFWVCPYTGRLFTDASDLDADHIVPLKWAWEHGAEEWSDARREEFANDQENILMVAANSNRSKGANGPKDWLPPNVAFGTEYIVRFMMMCLKYDLTYDMPAFAQLARELKIHTKGIKLNKLCEE